MAKGEFIIIRDPKFFSQELPEKLAEAPEKKLTKENIDAAESFGESTAPSLNQTRTIMPYSRAKVFAAKWGGDYQAHHIFEVQRLVVTRVDSMGSLVPHGGWNKITGAVAVGRSIDSAEHQRIGGDFGGKNVLDVRCDAA